LFYFSLWKCRLWKDHLAIFAGSVTIAGFYVIPTTGLGWLQVGLLGLLPIAGAFLFPQVMFKPKERILELNEQGLKTSIGSHHATIPWKRVLSVVDHGAAFVIQGVNLNAFIVPNRAFRSSEKRAQFLDFAAAHLDH
jgi:hypothetical protein